MTDALTYGRDSLGLQRLRRETKKRLEHFFSRLQALSMCKVSKKVMNGFQETV